MKRRKPTTGSHVTFVETEPGFVVNPFVSEAQQTACWAKDDPAWDCSEWSESTPEHLPETVDGHSRGRAKRKAARNARKATGKLSQLDPSRTLGMRRAFNAKLEVQFAALKGRTLKHIGQWVGVPTHTREDDALGLTVNRDLRADIHLAAQRVDQSPTEAQAQAGNYRKGRVTIQGLPITIETVKGTKRKPHHDKVLSAHYGYVRSFKGINTESEADGDHVDIFLADSPVDDAGVYVVDQAKDDGTFDEAKCLVGFPSQDAAEAAYRDSYPDNWQGLQAITALTIDQFKRWLRDGDTSRPITGQTLNSNPEGCNQYRDCSGGYDHEVAKRNGLLIGALPEDSQIDRDDKKKLIDPLTSGPIQRCFVNAAKEYAAQRAAGNSPKYVVGKVYGLKRGSDSAQYALGAKHAWVEVDGRISDPTFGKRMYKSVKYVSAAEGTPGELNPYKTWEGETVNSSSQETYQPFVLNGQLGWFQVANGNPNHDAKGRFSATPSSKLDEAEVKYKGTKVLPIKEEESWSDMQTFRESLRGGDVKDGYHVIEPYVAKVTEGKAKVEPNMTATWSDVKKGYEITEREPLLALHERTLYHGTSSEAPKSVADLKRGKMVGNWGENEYDAVYLTDNPSDVKQWGHNVISGKLAADAKVADYAAVREAMAKHPKLDKQEAVEAEGYHAVVHYDHRGGIREIAVLDPKKLVANAAFVPGDFSFEYVDNGIMRGSFGQPLGLVEVPDVRQDNQISCGAAAAMSVGRFFGVGPDTLAEWKELCKTDEDGTDPQDIWRALKGLGLRCVPRDGMTLDDLSVCQERGWPVLVPMQAWGTPAAERQGRSGHWVVVIGRLDDQYIFVQDPSMSNVVKEGVSNSNPDGCNQHTGPGCGKMPEKMKKEHVDRALEAMTPNDLPPGWRYAPDKLGPMTVAHNGVGDDPVLVSDKFFNTTPGMSRDGIVFHELGHSIPAFSKEDTEDTLAALEPFKKGKGRTSIHSRYDHSASSSGLPEEIVSDVYSQLMVLDREQERQGIKSQWTNEEPDGRHARLEKHVLKLAAKACLPVPEWSFEIVSNQTPNAPGRVMIREQDFLDAWHDVGADGTPYWHFGIAVGPPRVSNSNPNHDEKGRFAENDSVEDVLGAEGLVRVKLMRKNLIKMFKIPERICQLISPAIERDFGLKAVQGSKDGRAHMWNVLPNGDVLDASADQFGGGRQSIELVKAGTEEYATYKPRVSNANPSRDEHGRFASLHEAVDKLKHVEGYDPDTVEHGFDVKFSTSADGQRYVEAPYDVAKVQSALYGAKVKTVPLEGLIATQGGVSRSKLHAKVDDPLNDHRAIEIVKVGDKRWLHDGTHVAALAKLSGKDRIRARTVEVKDDGTVEPVVNVNPNHDELGRFAAGATEKLSHDSPKLAKLREEAANAFPAGPRRDEAINALKPSKHDVVIVQRDYEGVLSGVAQLWKTPDTANTEGVPLGRYIRLRNMATVQSGRGKALLDAVKEHASTQHAGLFLSALEGSKEFYVKHGFHEAVGSTYYLTHDELTGNTFSQEVHNAAADKLAQFQEWLKQQLGELVQGKTQEQLWHAYIRQGFNRGAGRAFDDVRKPFAKFYAKADAALPLGQRTQDFYDGSREEFLRSAFGQPVAKEKVELLASRSFDELENVTSDMSNKMSRVLTDGLVEGKSPHEVAADMVGEVDISRKRAEVVAQHELLKAHNAGQLIALRQLGVKKLGVSVEWSTSGLPSVCPRCEAMEGVVLDIDDAEGLLPLHVGCKCVWTPAGVGEDDSDQITDADDIQDAFDEADIDRVAKNAPRGVFNAWNPDQLRGPDGRWLNQDTSKMTAEEKTAYHEAWMDHQDSLYKQEHPEEYQERAPASEHVSQEVHDAAREQLTDGDKRLIAAAHTWETTKPWNVTKEQMQTNPPDGLALTKRTHGEAAHFQGGKVNLSPKFFDDPSYQHEELKRHILYHELGHKLADTMVLDGTSFQLHDAGVIPSKHDLGSGTGSGHGDEEALADVYATLHTDPQWLKDRFPKLVKPVVDRAKALGMPLPKEFTK